MKPITPFAFRSLVILSAVLALAGPLLDSIFMPSLPLGHTQLLFPRTSLLFTSLNLFNFLLGIATTIGFCMFWRWSRPASLISIVLGIALYTMSAYFLDSGIKAAVDSVSTILNGATLAIAYFSPIADRFESGDATS